MGQLNCRTEVEQAPEQEGLCIGGRVYDNDSYVSDLFFLNSVDQEEGGQPDGPVTNFLDIPLEGFETQDPLTALPFFCQLATQINHRLLLPRLPGAIQLEQESMHMSFDLDYFMAIGTETDMSPIIIDPEIRGMAEIIVSIG